jgi:hypothetical protein
LVKGKNRNLKKRKKGVRGRREFRAVPTLHAIDREIFTEKYPKLFTGLEERGILKK